MAERQDKGIGAGGWPLLLPLLALVPVFPLLVHGPSCGHDYGFHLRSWMEAAHQLRQGVLFPRWAYSPAYNAGEPRFLFYPPLSWLLGALLVMALPVNAAPAVFTWLALTGAAAGMYALARRFASPAASMLAAALYIGNPYIFFTAIERTAYAELLAASILPLLLRAALAPQLRVLGLAVPLALLWLCNAPAAVMGTYMLGVVLCARVYGAARAPEAAGRHAIAQQTTGRGAVLRSIVGPATGGVLLGLALPAFYLLPAAWQRRYVQIDMAIIPNMRVEDNFLFGHTAYVPHNEVLHTASLVAVWLVGLTAIALALAWVQLRTEGRSGRAGGNVAEQAVPLPSPGRPRAALMILSLLALLASLLVWHFTLPVWHLLPEMVFLQFPWRLMAVLGCVFGLGVALAARRLPAPAAAVLALAWLLGGTALVVPAFRQQCTVDDAPAVRLQRFRAQYGVEATDEYTPVDADNDQLRWDDPAWWLTEDPAAPGPGTVPNPAATITDYDQPPPLDQTLSGRAPMRLQLHLTHPEDLVLNLRAYPTWQVLVNGHIDADRLQRDDGLLAIALPAGEDRVEIRWHRLPDMLAGDLVSLLALVAAAGVGIRSRRIKA